jgi:hypothetical protein
LGAGRSGRLVAVIDIVPRRWGRRAVIFQFFPFS